MNQPWVLFDASFLSHRARSVIKGMSFGDLPTGVIYGFLEAIRTECFDPRIMSNKVALCFDSRQSHRKKLFPTYKTRNIEEQSPEEQAERKLMYEQIDRLREEILPDLGFPIYRQVGLESDDLFAQICLQVQSGAPEKKAVMVTSDGDLFQCITETTHWFDPIRDLYLDPASFWVFKKTRPEKWGVVKALAGCHGDTVPGIPTIGEKTAIKYLMGELKHQSKAWAAIESSEGKKIFDRNHELVVLPHINTKPVKLVEPKYNFDALMKWGERLGLKSYLEGTRRQAWEAIFSGSMTTDRQQPRRRGQEDA